MNKVVSVGAPYMWDGSGGKMAAAMFQMSCLYRGMLAVRVPGVRTLIPGLVPAQFRTFSLRKEPELEENPFYGKYQDRIQRLRRSAANIRIPVRKNHYVKLIRVYSSLHVM